MQTHQMNISLQNLECTRIHNTAHSGVSLLNHTIRVRPSMILPARDATQPASLMPQCMPSPGLTKGGSRPPLLAQEQLTLSLSVIVAGSPNHLQMTPSLLRREPHCVLLAHTPTKSRAVHSHHSIVFFTLSAGLQIYM